ncbi:MAG: hypothetical protein ACHQAY_28440, partial [Hyphomicrobiales bacterium]
ELDAEDEAEAKRKADAALRARYTHEAVIASLLWERQTLDDRLAQRDAADKRALLATKWS